MIDEPLKKQHDAVWAILVVADIGREAHANVLLIFAEPLHGEALNCLLADGVRIVLIRPARNLPEDLTMTK